MRTIKRGERASSPVIFHFAQCTVLLQYYHLPLGTLAVDVDGIYMQKKESRRAPIQAPFPVISFSPLLSPLFLIIVSGRKVCSTLYDFQIVWSRSSICTSRRLSKSSPYIECFHSIFQRKRSCWKSL